jgi:hypothetical protein
MEVPYKIYPASNDPGYNGITQTWLPIVSVSLLVGHTKSKRFDALINSGAFTTFFHADIGRAVSLKVETGEVGELRGVVAGSATKVYYHSVRICLAEHTVLIKAGFYDRLGFAGILGRHGFFEHFAVPFDPSNIPPGLEITRIHRA